MNIIMIIIRSQPVPSKLYSIILNNSGFGLSTSYKLNPNAQPNIFNPIQANITNVLLPIKK